MSKHKRGEKGRESELVFFVIGIATGSPGTVINPDKYAKKEPS